MSRSSPALLKPAADRLRPAANRLFGSLPGDVRERLAGSLEPASCALGDVLCQAGARIDRIYFPTTAVVSLVHCMENGATGEVGLVGNEGLVGLPLFMGAESTPTQSVIQAAGDVFWIPARILQEEFRRGGAFQLALLRYTQSLLTQISQTAVCNRLHTVEKRLCRWLLLVRDRVPSDRLAMTQDFVAQMLGVRREGVTSAAKNLQAQGLIRCSRGHIEILDRDRLEDEACECYRVVRDEAARLSRLAMAG